MRLNTLSCVPPNQMGMGRCTGSGFSPASVILCQRPSYVTSSRVQSARMTSICSSERRPRLWKSSPRASYSTSFQPIPIPNRRRPPVSTSTSAACLAMSAVWRWGVIRMPVTSSIPLRDAGQVAEEHHGLVEHVGVLVRAAPTRTAPGVRAEHVVVHEQVLVAHLLDGLGVVPYARRVGPDLGLRKDHSDTHSFSYRFDDRYYTRRCGAYGAAPPRGYGVALQTRPRHTSSTPMASSTTPMAPTSLDMSTRPVSWAPR